MKINPIGHLVKTNPIRTQTNPILSAVGGLQMNVTSLITVEYENKSNWTLGENEPNTNPIKPNSNPILSAVGGFQMNLNFYLTKDYNNEQ